MFDFCILKNYKPKLVIVNFVWPQSQLNLTSLWYHDGWKPKVSRDVVHLWDDGDYIATCYPSYLYPPLQPNWVVCVICTIRFWVFSCLGLVSVLPRSFLHGCYLYTKGLFVHFYRLYCIYVEKNTHTYKYTHTYK